MKIVDYETHWEICDECGHEVEYQRPIYKKTFKDHLRWLKKKILFWRGPSDLEKINRVITDIYQPSITNQLFEESLLMKRLREKQDGKSST